ncbi:MAG: ribosome biogenesis GTPase YlqF [Clostridia bacterium]|nr:ribosome biogenesis GTPase YlqF [Clostridia bacterium]
MQTINWYPGHMTKARRMLEENIKLVDIVVEVVDARCPMACRNPDFESLFKNKIRVVFMNKSDLSAKEANKAWIARFKSQGITAAELVSTSQSAKKIAISIIESAGKPIIEKYKEKGIRKVLRAMVIGVPNVGKSTIINRIAGAARAQVGDRPGVTRSKQWVKVSDYLELLDTPGLLWGKLENETLAKHLAYIGSIRDDVLDIEEIASLLLYDLMRFCSNELISRYKKLDKNAEIPYELLEGVCRSRGFILSGGHPDTERAARIVLDEYRGGKIANVSLEKPGDDFGAADSSAAAPKEPTEE